MNALRYFQRSQRYVFQPEDNRLLRFAVAAKRGEYTETETLNISESGVLFVVRNVDPPEVGHIIKVEFTVPHRQSIACYATVVRREERETRDPKKSGIVIKCLVAAHFLNLPTLHRRSLHLGLQRALGQAKDEVIDWSEQRRLHGYALSVFSVLMFGGLFLLAQSELSALEFLLKIF